MTTTTQRPLNSFLFSLARRRFTMHPGLVIAQKDCDSTQTHLWVGAFLHHHATETLPVRITLSTRSGDHVAARDVALEWYGIANEAEISGWAADSRFFHGHVSVAIPGEVDLVARADWTGTTAAQALTATCRVRLLPPALSVGAELAIVTASCFDGATDDPKRSLAAAYERVHAEPDRRRPDLVLLTGDQVYADTPWWAYAIAARATPRTSALLEYWASWGGQLHPDGTPKPGIRSILTDGPTWFLPDDHEFWNNWPHASFTAKHSFANQGQGLRWGLRRTISSLLSRLGRTPDVTPPEKFETVPATADQRNFLPVHPDEWEAWSRAAFDLYGSFQTRSLQERQGGAITRGSRNPSAWREPDSAPRGAAHGEVHPPLTPPVQIIDVDPVHIVLLDTRTRRTRTRHHPKLSRFVDDRYLDQVLEVAARAPVLILAMPEPALRKAEGWRPSIPLASDFGIRHYTAQYAHFWTELEQRRAGRPTVFLGGDIHTSRIADACDRGVVEIVASPMSLVYGDNFKERVKARLHRADPVGNPLEGAPFDSVVRAALPTDPVQRRGFATLALRRETEHTLALEVELHSVDGTVPTRPVRYRLRTDGKLPKVELVATTPASP